MENNNQQSFWQFSDQLRLQTSSLDNLSLNSSIWSNNNYATNTKRTNQRRNFDVNSFTEFNPSSSSSSSTKSSDLSFFSVPHIHQNTAFGDLNGGFNKGSYSNSTTPSYVNNNSNMINLKGHKAGFVDFQQTKSGRKNTNTNDVAKNATDKKLKTLPPSESLPRQESVGGYIFVCNNDTMAENLKRQLFGLPPRYRDSVRAITPGLPLFLYNYSTHQLHGIFEAASFGGNNIDPTAWEDKKCSGESRFPAQVKVINRKNCEPLEEDSFRPILHHYDGPKFRLELSVAEAMSLLDIFADQNSFDDIFKAIPA